MRVLRPLVLAACLTTIPALAFAGDVEQARAAFEAGAKAYREARYQDAIDSFLAANRLDPHPELVFNVGQAYEKLGDVPNALRSFREYLRLSPAASDRAAVEASIVNLERRLRERGVQQVSVFSTPPGAVIVLDDRPVGATPWTGEIAPGRHIVVLKAAGFADTAKEFVLTDRSVDLDVALAAPGSAAVPVAPATTPRGSEPGSAVVDPAAESHPEAHGATVKPWTWGALGLGAVGLGAALGFELSRRGAESDARSAPSQVAYADAYDRMQSRQGTARVLAGIGAAATIAGGVLLYFDVRSAAHGSTTGDSAHGSGVAFGCGGEACGLFAKGSF